MPISSTIYSWTDSANYEWVDSDILSWNQFTSGYLNQIYTDEHYVYAAYSNGLDIIDINLEEKVAYIEQFQGFTTVCGNNTTVYLGAGSGGIVCIDKTCVSGSITEPYDLTTCLVDFVSVHSLGSTVIRNLFILDKTLSVTTPVGIDVLTLVPQGYKSSTTAFGISKSFLTTKRELYYLTESDKWTINKINSHLFDWTVSDASYKVTESFLFNDVIIRDFFVTENTSLVVGHNTLFLATSSGVYVYDEGADIFEIYYSTL